MKPSTILIAATATLVATAAALGAQPLIGASTAAPPDPGIIDLSTLVHDGAQYILALIGSLAYYEFQNHVKDQRARDAFRNAVDNGVELGLNTIDGALKGHPLTVKLASPVAAEGVRYVLDRIPDALKRLGLTEADVAHTVVAKLPGIEGGIDDAAIRSIAAAATGKATDVRQVGIADVEALIGPALEAYLSSRMRAATQPAATDVQKSTGG